MALHSAGKTTIGELKRNREEGKRIAAHIPGQGGGGGKPDSPLGGEESGTEVPPLVQNPPAGSVVAPVIVKGIVSRVKPPAAAIAAVTTLTTKRDYGYVLSHIPFGASVTKTLESIGE